MKKIMNRTALLISMLASTLVCATFLASTSFADELKGSEHAPPPKVLLVGSNPFGQSYKEWVIDFTKWAYSIPPDINPVFNGTNGCTQPQYGKVWFVATGGFPATCEVPNGKAIMIHMGVYFDTYPCPEPPPFQPALGQSLESFLVADAKTVVDGLVSKGYSPNELYIDGKPVVDTKMLRKLRVSSGLFSLTADISTQSVDGCVVNGPQKAVTDGWFAIIDGLKPGIHRFQFINSHTGAYASYMDVTIANNKIKGD